MSAVRFCPRPVPRQTLLTRVIVAASLGNASNGCISWLRLFRGHDSESVLPSGNETASLLLAFGTFSVSFWCALSAPS